MPEVLEIKKRGRGRPPGAKNKPKPVIQKRALASETKVLKNLGTGNLKINPKIARELSRLCDATGFTLQRIYDDMCANGIIEIQTTYLEIINARRELQKALDSLDGKTIPKALNKPEPAVRNGEFPPEVRTAARGPRAANAGPREPREPQPQPDVATEQRGLGSPPKPDPDDSFAVGLTDEPEEPEDEEPGEGDV